MGQVKIKDPYDEDAKIDLQKKLNWEMGHNEFYKHSNCYRHREDWSHLFFHVAYSDYKINLATLQIR